MYRFYIGCDRCQDWFHGRCVGVSQVEANHMDVYICPNCEKKEEVDPISQKILQEKDYENVRRLVKSMQVCWSNLGYISEKIFCSVVLFVFLGVNFQGSACTYISKLDGCINLLMKDTKDIQKNFATTNFNNSSVYLFFIINYNCWKFIWKLLFIWCS